MTTTKATKAPTKREIEASARDDLREVYLLAFDQFAITPSDVEVYTTDRINTRYARELLGVLVHEKLLAVGDNGEGEDVWQVVNPGTYDEHTEEEAVAVIDEFLNRKIPTSTTPKKETKVTTTATRPTSSKPKNETGKCLCGCGENTAKSNYRPGHDARHAGNIAREIAANYATPGFDRRTLLAALPSDALKAKAEAMAERLTTKAEAKKKPVETRVFTAKAKVGRTTYEGTIEKGEGDEPDTFHYVDSKHNEKQTTKFTVVDA